MKSILSNMPILHPTGEEAAHWDGHVTCSWACSGAVNSKQA